MIVALSVDPKLGVYLIFETAVFVLAVIAWQVRR